MEKGYLQIYTGNGKGKTCAVLGLAVRAAGAGLRILLIQFMKQGFPYSELSSLQMLKDNITVEQYGNDLHVLEKRPPTKAESEAVRRGLDRAHEAFAYGEYDIIILDEICVTVKFGLLSEEEVNTLLDNRPDNVELILTGRYCPQSWIDRADLVTEMKEVRHYFAKRVLSREGIDC